MPKHFDIAFKIGGALTGAFKSSIGGASRQINRLGSEINRLEQSRKRVDRFSGLQVELRKTGSELSAARIRAAELKKQFSQTRRPTKKLRAEMASAGKTVARLESKLRGQRLSLGRLRGQLTAAGVNTRKLSSEQNRLAGSIDRVKRAQERLNKAVMRGRKIRQQRRQMQGRLAGAAALGASVAAPVYAAAQNQRAETRLSTAINAQDKARAMADARKTARELTQAGVTSFADAYNIQYALNSAGLTASAARLGTEVVAKVATVTSGIPETVGEVIATAYNNLGDQLQGTTEQKMNRLGDLLTKIQLKYQLRDFSQLGESMKYGASGLANYNVRLSQGVMLLGQLNSAGLQGSMAGTALNAVLRNLGKSQAQWGAEVVRDNQGRLDMVATLERMREALDRAYGSDIDARAQAIQKVFGDEGARGLVPMLKALDQLKAGQQDVIEGSKGLVNSEFKKFSNDALGQTKKLTGNLMVMADALARSLLPAVNVAVSGLAGFAGMITAFTDKFPNLSKAIVLVGGSLAALTVGVAAGGYAFTFIQGGIAGAVKVFALLRNSTALATAAQWALNLALNANPIGLVVTAVGALIGVGILLYKKWEPFRQLIDALWAKLKKFAALAFKFSPLGIGAKLIGGIVKGIRGKENEPAQAIGKSMQKVDDLLPHSDARKGPLSNLTASGRSIAETMGKGARRAGAGALQESLSGLAAVGGSGGVQINFAPTVNLPAGSDAAAARRAVDAGLAESESRLKVMLERVMAGERRLSFA